MSASKGSSGKTAGWLAVLTVGTLAVAGGAALYFRPVHARDAIPGDAFFAVHINATALRQSPVASAVDQLLPALQKELADDHSEVAKALDQVARANANCGFSLLSRLDEVALFGRFAGAVPDTAIALRGNVTADELSTCSKGSIPPNGTSGLTHEGSFYRGTVGAASMPLTPSLAFALGPRRPLLLGTEAMVTSSIAAVDGRESRFGTLGGAKAPWASNLTLRGQFLKDAAAPENLMVAWAKRPESAPALFAPLALLGTPPELSRALPKVTEVLFSMASAPNGDIQAVFRAECTDVPACKDLETFFGRTRFELGKNLAFRLMGLGKLIDGAQVASAETDGHGTVTVRVTLDEATLGAAQMLTPRK